MISNWDEIDRAVREYDRTHPLTFEQKLHLMESMYELARRFGYFTRERILEGIEDDIEIARILNANGSGVVERDLKNT